MPRALVVAMFILFVLSILTLVINSGIGGGARELIQKESFGNGGQAGQFC